MIAMEMRFSLMGPPEVRGPDGCLLTGCGQSLALLAFLATRPGRAAERDGLAHSLWGEAEPERQRARLSTALWRVRRLIAEAGLPAEAVFACADETVALRSDAPIWLDFEELRRAWRVARASGGLGLGEETARALRAGADLYRGNFLAGHDEDWCLIERESLNVAYQAILDRLLDHHVEDRAWRAVIEVARLVLALDPLLEHAHRAAIRAHGALGERAQAVQQYRRCERLLAEELDVAPLPETEATLRAALAVAPGRPAEIAGSRSGPSLGAIISELRAAVRELERLNGAE